MDQNAISPFQKHSGADYLYQMAGNEVTNLIAEVTAGAMNAYDIRRPIALIGHRSAAFYWDPKEAKFCKKLDGTGPRGPLYMNVAPRCAAIFNGYLPVLVVNLTLKPARTVP
jgi:hypothetical protein